MNQKSEDAISMKWSQEVENRSLIVEKAVR